jgi:hypothetical protein
MELFEDLASQDSRARGIFLGLGPLDFGPIGVADAVTFDFDERVVTFDNPTVTGPSGDEIQGNRQLNTFSNVETGTWDYDPSGRFVRVDDGGGDLFQYAVSEDGSVLIAGIEQANVPLVLVEVLVEKPDKPPTVSDLAGTYWFGEFELGAETFGPNPGPTALFLLRGFGSFTLHADGRVTGRIDGREQIRFSGGSNVDRFSEGIGGGTWSIADSTDGKFEGSVIITDQDEGDTEEFRLLFSKNGQVAVGTDRQPIDDGALLTIAVRQSAGLRASDLSGEYSTFILESELIAYNPPTVPQEVPDWQLFQLAERRVYDGVNRVNFFVVDELSVRRQQGAQPGGVLVERLPDDGGDFDKYTITKTGKVRLVAQDGDPDVFVGAMASNGQFGFSMDDPTGPLDIYGFDLWVKAPKGLQTPQKR